MEQLYRAFHLPTLGHVALFATEAATEWLQAPLPTAQPRMLTRGLAIPVARSEQEIEVVVSRSTTPPALPAYLSASILVGPYGLTVGTEATVDTGSIRCPIGVVRVDTYLDARTQPPHIHFVLSPHLPRKARPTPVFPAILLADIDALLKSAHQPYPSPEFPHIGVSAACYWPLPVLDTIAAQMQRDDYLLGKLRERLHGTSFLAYKHLATWFDLHHVLADGLVMIRGSSQYDIVRWELGTLLDQPPTSADWHIAQLQQLQRSFGMTITGVSQSVLECFLHQVPTGKRRIHFIDMLLHFCPDIVQSFPDAAIPQGDVGREAIYASPYFDLIDGRMALWWD